ncbi:hypothetical protein A5482_014505 (plasmid) [Cyanobacterium sp. IPPAS B-1200]|uniref:hypothetical protein n=1 Tax=Cyanobacterium sp. IPPAS B-1200 TaxID=1562720 RepID=UPI00085283BC|nr:hypothetical protein [Cyanobacterium sp. IPPAS B-1200]OEJ78055.1 hypothetical protein A5482_14445 [Cyanobacterium sp. IPPAS B-1200]
MNRYIRSFKAQWELHKDVIVSEIKKELYKEKRLSQVEISKICVKIINKNLSEYVSFNSISSSWLNYLEKYHPDSASQFRDILKSEINTFETEKLAAKDSLLGIHSSTFLVFVFGAAAALLYILSKVILIDYFNLNLDYNEFNFYEKAFFLIFIVIVPFGWNYKESQKLREEKINNTIDIVKRKMEDLENRLCMIIQN